MTDATPQVDANPTVTKTEEVRVVLPSETGSGATTVIEVKAAPVDPALAARVLKQVEFYFGNSNLPKDNHLRGLTQKGEGWVDIAHIASFPKMLALTKDFDAVVSALRGSKELLEVDETGTKLRRKMPVPDDLDTNPFSIYAKGFPKDYTLEQVDAFFQPYLQPGEEIRCTRLRRLKDRAFKGSVFIEFSSEAAADRLTKTELKSPDETRNEPLLVLMKAAYFKKKNAERDAEKALRKGKSGVKTEEGEADKGETDKGGKRKRDDEHGEGKREFTRELTPGMIICVNNLPESVDKFKLSQAITNTGAKVAFVDLNKGGPSYVRLARETEVSAKDVLAKLEQEDFKFGDQKPEFSILEGEAEKAHWTQIWDAQEKHFSGSRGRGGKRGGGRGGRGGGGRGGGRGGGKKQRRDD